MSNKLDINDEVHLRQAIISQCIWSDAYSSLKHILKKTANQLPLLILFDDNNNNSNEQEDISNTNRKQTILFFDRNVSNKILFTPLKHIENQQEQFEVYPHHCTFAITDLFKGLFEFVRNGKRCSHIYTNLEQLIHFATDNKCSAVFMSRDRLYGYYSDSNISNWKNREYSQGAIFQAQRIHRSSFHNNTDNYLECLDEDGFTIFLKMFSNGRFSLISISTEQQQNQPEIFLHSTQTHNINQLIKRITDENTNNCIRLVRGPVPHNFYCQYLKLVRQHTYDILVGLTDEGLVIEWNLESHASCRYAINLNDILNKLYGTWEEQILESSIDQARTHYRENFPINMQLISTKDWTAFFQYWKWISTTHSIDKNETNIPYQSRHRFHLIASIQDLSDDFEMLSSKFKKTSKEIIPKRNRKNLSTKQQLFLSEMSKVLSSPSINHKKNRLITSNPQRTSLLATNTETIFDDSIYDSNQHHSSSPNITKINLKKQNARRTQ